MQLETANENGGEKLRKRKIDWEDHDQRIHDAYLRLMQDRKGRRPTIRELAAETGLSKKTIENHIQGLRFEPMKDPMRILTRDVINAIWKKSVAGNVPAQKLWLQVQEGWRETSDVRHSGDPQNPVAVTNTTTVVNVREFIEGKDGDPLSENVEPIEDEIGDEEVQDDETLHEESTDTTQ